jgi:chromatin assembly factor 1 subunit B
MGSSRYRHTLHTDLTVADLLIGDTLASAGDDGTVITWVQDSRPAKPTFGEDGVEDKETWRTKHMYRASQSEVYDLAWSPDGIYFITGSMDNIARIYNAQTGELRDHAW